jgi:hypothetical protein
MALMTSGKRLRPAPARAPPLRPVLPAIGLVAHLNKKHLFEFGCTKICAGERVPLGQFVEIRPP